MPGQTAEAGRVLPVHNQVFGTKDKKEEKKSAPVKWSDPDDLRPAAVVYGIAIVFGLCFWAFVIYLLFHLH